MDYFLPLLASGLLSGAVYALVGAAFVVVYRASTVLNFSLGEWVSLGARLTGVGVQAAGLPVPAAILAALALLTGIAALFNRVVVRRLQGRPVIAIVMATLALGVLMQAGARATLGRLPSTIPFPLAGEYWVLGPLVLPPSRLIASGTAILLLLLTIAFFRKTRAGLAIRAIADDGVAAVGMGISPVAYLTLAWAISGALAVAGGVLWSIDGLGGFSMVLVLAKVLPVVVIGGLTSFAGAFVGAIAVGVAESLSAGYLDPILGPGFSGVVAAILVITMLCIRPNGLFGARPVARV